MQGQLAVAVQTTHMQKFRGSCSTDATFAQWLVGNMSHINNVEDVTEQSDASVGCIARAYSSLRGSVDFCYHRMCSKSQNL